MQQHYLSSWQNMLNNLLGWAELDASQWLQSAKETWDMTNFKSDVFHESPSYWIVETIVTSMLPYISNSDYELLERSVLRLLDTPYHDFTMKTDWAFYKRGLGKIIGDYHRKKNEIWFTHNRMSALTFTNTRSHFRALDASGSSGYQLISDLYVEDHINASKHMAVKNETSDVVVTKYLQVA